MFLEVISPSAIIYRGEISLVQMPGKMGSFEILHNHAPIAALLVPGKMKIIDMERNIVFLSISHGLVHAKNNRITIVTEKDIEK